MFLSALLSSERERERERERGREQAMRELWSYRAKSILVV